MIRRFPFRPSSQSHRSRAGHGTACFFVLALAAGPCALPVHADVLDQENAAASFAWRRCGGTGRSLFQSFMPRFTPLAAVALDIREVPAEGEMAHIRVRIGWTQGAVIAETVAAVTADGWTRFAFVEPVAVKPGTDYFIEWVQPRSWWAVASGNPYPRGEAYNCGEILLALDDYNFRTFAPAARVESRPWAEVKAILSGALAR